MEPVPTACYIHTPFCDHKCIYCDFYSIITSDNIEPFLEALKQEIIFSGEKYDTNRELISIYFGGGTPSLMKPDYIYKIIQTIKGNFEVKSNAEITLETNPGTVSPEKLNDFKEIGINRLSVGIQSFDESDLKFLTRVHNSGTARETVANAFDSGFENVSIDLIFNLPSQAKEKWLYNLETAVRLPVKHISAYSLILERGTILNKMVLDGKVELQEEDHDADLYETTIEFLGQNGFEQYEVSNFSLPGYQSIHNKAYWRYNEYIGFGTSAHSFINGKRWWNFSSLKKYISEITSNKSAVAGEEILTEEQMRDEYILLALRSTGIDAEDYTKRFNSDWIMQKYSYFQKLKNEGLVLMNGNKIKLTGKGYALCDEILRNIF